MLSDLDLKPDLTPEPDFNPQVGDTIYIISQIKRIIYFYTTCNIQDGNASYQKKTIQYDVNPDGNNEPTCIQ